jgi:hypothetical protein
LLVESAFVEHKRVLETLSLAFGFV